MDSITRHPAVMLGKPCIAGTRITVELVLELLGAGWTQDMLSTEYHLTAEQIRAALTFAAKRLQDDEDLLLAAG